MTPDRTHMVALCLCGYRLGLHRFGDDVYPNWRWKPGNGQPQWRKAVFHPAILKAAA